MLGKSSNNKSIATNRRFKGIVIIVILISIGVVGLIITRAATISLITLEPEIKAKGPVDIYESNTASNNQYVRFSGQTPLAYSSYINNGTGVLANELNVASNGSWTWNNIINTSGAEKYRVTINAPKILAKDKYFWSSSFVWSNNRGSGGYIGLQSSVGPVGGNRGVIFSIWNTTVAEAIGSGKAQPFSGEGIGMQTAQSLNWAWNTDYEVYVSRISDRSNSSYNWWLGYARNTNTNTITEIGRIRTPASWGYMVPNNNFLERYGASNTCGLFEPASGEFKYLRAQRNGSYYSPSAVRVEKRQYTDCTNVVSTSSVPGGYNVTINQGTK